MKYFGLILAVIGFTVSALEAVDYFFEANRAAFGGWLCASLWAAVAIVKELIILGRK